MTIRLLMVDDHAVVRSGLRMILEADAAIKIVGEADNGADAVQQAFKLQPDGVIMDIGLPDMSGIEATDGKYGPPITDRRLRQSDENVFDERV